MTPERDPAAASPVGTGSGTSLDLKQPKTGHNTRPAKACSRQPRQADRRGTVAGA